MVLLRLAGIACSRCNSIFRFNRALGFNSFLSQHFSSTWQEYWVLPRVLRTGIYVSVLANLCEFFSRSFSHFLGFTTTSALSLCSSFSFALVSKHSNNSVDQYGIFLPTLLLALKYNLSCAHEPDYGRT